MARETRPQGWFLSFSPEWGKVPDYKLFLFTIAGVFYVRSQCLASVLHFASDFEIGNNLQLWHQFIQFVTFFLSPLRRGE